MTNHCASIKIGTMIWNISTSILFGLTHKIQLKCLSQTPVTKWRFPIGLRTRLNRQNSNHLCPICFPTALVDGLGRWNRNCRIVHEISSCYVLFILTHCSLVTYIYMCWRTNGLSPIHHKAIISTNPTYHHWESIEYSIKTDLFIHFLQDWYFLGGNISLSDISQSSKQLHYDY